MPPDRRARRVCHYPIPDIGQVGQHAHSGKPERNRENNSSDRTALRTTPLSCSSKDVGGLLPCPRRFFLAHSIGFPQKDEETFLPYQKSEVAQTFLIHSDLSAFWTDTLFSHHDKRRRPIHSSDGPDGCWPPCRRADLGRMEWESGRTGKV